MKTHNTPVHHLIFIFMFMMILFHCAGCEGQKNTQSKEAHHLEFIVPKEWQGYISAPQKWQNYEGVIPFRPDSYLRNYIIPDTKGDITLTPKERADLARLLIQAEITMNALEPEHRRYIYTKSKLFTFLKEEYPNIDSITTEGGSIVWMDDLAKFAKQSIR